MGWAAWTVGKRFLKEKVMRRAPPPPPTIAERAKSRQAITPYAVAAGARPPLSLPPRRCGHPRLPPAPPGRRGVSSIEHGPPREQFNEVYRYYTLAKRAEW